MTTLKHFFEVYRPKAPDEQKFVDKHVAIKHKDRNGNGDDVFKGNTKYIKRKEERHGYDVGEDEKVYEEVEDLEELSRATISRYSQKAKSIADNEGGKDRTKGRELAGRKNWGGTMKGVEKARVPATNEEVEHLEEGTMKLSKVHIVHHHDHPAAKEFAKHYTDAMKGDHREGGPTEKDEAASNKFHERYSSVRTREGFAGSGTHVYTDHKTGAKWKVDRHPNGKTFYGTDHIISHHTGDIHEGLEEGEYLDTSVEDRVIRSLVAYYEELGEEVLIDDIASLAEQMLDELSVKTLDSYRTKARKELIDADANDDNSHYNKRAKGYRAASKSVSKKFAKEEVEELDELSTDTLQSYRKKARAQGNAIVDKMKMGGGDWSKDQKNTKTLRKRASGAQMSGKTLRKRGESLKTEEVEQIDELSRKTLGSYIKKASPSASAALATAVSSSNPDSIKSASKKFSRRTIGIDRAVNKLTKEDVINRAISKYVPEDIELPSMEERLVAKLQDTISEAHILTLLELFGDLTEENQIAMLDIVETQEGINGLIDFALENRGE